MAAFPANCVESVQLPLPSLNRTTSHTPGAGRGVVVTRDVAPGELLLCCHPLAVVTGGLLLWGVAQEVCG